MKNFSTMKDSTLLTIMALVTFLSMIFFSQTDVVFAAYVVVLGLFLTGSSICKTIEEKKC